MLIRKFETKDLARINEIAKQLHPKWFDDNALASIPIDVKVNLAYVLEEESQIQGFIVASSKDGVGWINWLAVDLLWHGKGVGTSLLTKIEEELKSTGVKSLKVETVVEQSPGDGSYDMTIRFYLKNGFVVVEKGNEETFEEFTFKKGVLEKSL